MKDDGIIEGIFNIRGFGAIGDGRVLDTSAVQAAVDTCAAAGGGTVLCPPGTYLIGTVELKSHVNLHINGGATLLGSTNRAHYRSVAYGNPERGPVMVKEHLFIARDAEEVSLTGQGTIDGQGDSFFGPPVGKHLSLRGWRPERMFGIVECRRVRIEDVTIRNSAGWALWLLGCDNVRIRGISIFNNPLGPNTDGIDPDCCSNVNISDCRIDAGDDCIALKSDAYLLGRAKACENITVTNCSLSTTCCGVRIGYEGDAPIRNCVFSNLVMTRCRTGINMLVPRHTEGDIAYIQHGPAIEDIRFSNLVMDTKVPVYLWIGDDASAPGGIRNIAISDCFATSERACYIGGAKDLPIEGVHISGFRLEVRGEMDNEFGTHVPYPYSVWDYFNKKGIPHAFYCRHARGLEFHNVRVVWGKAVGSWRSALRAEHVQDLDISGFVAKQAPGAANAAVVHVTDSQCVSLRNCRAESGTGSFLRMDGPATRRISVTGNDLTESANPIEIGEGVPKETVFSTDLSPKSSK